MSVAKDNQKPSSHSNSLWWLTFIIIVSITFATRFYKVTEPDHVCWDETHFGKMGSWYINRTFFFDVHPPLGKMLIALSGYLTGYDGKFAFDKPGDKYEDTNYVGMRVFCTALGASIVPMAYLIVWECTQSISSAFFAALLILFDVGLLTLTQYILLDPLLLCFMMGSVLGMVKVSSKTQSGDVFQWNWWGWLLFTGTMLALCISVKFVGLFVILLVGLFTISDLWRDFGDLSKPVIFTVKQLFARALCLIIWPALVYMLIFYIHLRVLNKSGNGDGFYSSAFQSQLEGNGLHGSSMPLYVGYGAVVTIKNQRTGGGYLHSHPHLYPAGVGARQQQITTYTHKDDNNKWLIKKYNTDTLSDDVELVKNGDLVRLEHVTTKRNLHSHRLPAPLTKKFYQVTGYGEAGIGDANDVWKIIVDGEKGDDGKIYTVKSKIHFVHYLLACALTVSGKQLPKWGYEQQEVACNPNLRDPSAVWNVEENIFPKLPNVSFSVYAPSFLERFIESHAVMFQGNAGLKPKEGEVTSRPWQWPINYRGQFFSGSSHRVYLLGNPIIWWGNLIFLTLFLIIFIINIVKEQRRKHQNNNKVLTSKPKLMTAVWLFVGWILHYVPFWAMGRVLYFHHYFPALLFSSMLTGVMLDYIISGIIDLIPNDYKYLINHTIKGSLVAALSYSFIIFSPLSYGMNGPTASETNSSMHRLKWLDTWEF
ncbi:protein O-mannosyl-transferase 2 [Chrysoperla carnea]|uniref:protein O-mannosyl-transferase 2 n=1 Tax=Chrysoperla carnea TaxID=189513 RepID=UPI001D069494|nr:protein O-mannosyl-transferase 2 [Chrysoperla carnea]